MKRGQDQDTFFTAEGGPLRTAHLFILIDPGALAGQAAYYDRLETLVQSMLEDEGVRLAGARRLALERQARVHGIRIPQALHQQIVDLLPTAP
ncbi:MAG: (2R)-3-sulfolactate dehydrogenase (NADP(+)) [Paracidovorax wautersii]|uniref:(2R)-3-sulfolactate dehydrogenase (NADP(+)) n=1 Tax=Paracidovorax wautersii TaxID=1177982 RepID=A0A7V8JNJ8_9BURK|nr:MAG: (2R)-3-sulfolactate dehydrogenase (NADP(+)) [Paracidovorax wautersii]